MPLALVVAGLLVASGPPDAGPPPTDAAAAYQEARMRAGRSPDDQVRLALWCEAHGLPVERLKHLALAVLANPRHAAARALMGLVAYDGRWQRPEAVAESLKGDPARAALLEQYDGKRLKAPYTAEGQMALGVWADEHGLKDQARAHLTATVRLDPSRELAWKRLGYRKHENRWVTDAQLVAEKTEAEAQKLADKHWKATLERIKNQLDQPSKRDEAEATLAAITDPRAVPSIARAFVTDRPNDQARAVRLLGQIEGPAASRTLAALAVFSKSGEIRRVAIETLKQRDARDFVRLWIALIRKPIRYEVRPVGGPGSPGALFVEGARANVQRNYAPPAMPNLGNLAGGALSYDNDGMAILSFSLPFQANNELSAAQFEKARAQNRQQTAASNRAAENQFSNLVPAGDAQVLTNALRRPPSPFDNIIDMTKSGTGPRVVYIPTGEKTVQIPVGEMMRQVQIAATVAQQQLASDVATLDQSNVLIHGSNEPVLQALKSVTGGDIGEDAAAWSRWWTEQEGYAATEDPEATKPTIFENVPIAYSPMTVRPIITDTLTGFVERRQHSCFAAGTPVRTIDGSRAIESIRAGDLVMVQDTIGGGLGYQPVVAVFHNPPNQTFRVDLGSDAVVATGIHRFWKAGKGWTMARDLRAGDVLRTLGGVATVASVEPARVQPVFNLEVASGRSFFVGQGGTLVHDNSQVEAVPHPFDAVAAAR